ncbi:MAG: lipoyl(octanoyl) transferase LipB [Bernardetiaceae bacterium]
MTSLHVQALTTCPYAQAWAHQETLLEASIHQKRQTGTSTNHLLFYEHPPVFTLGKSGDVAHLLKSEQECQDLGVAFFKINRGGDITFHGPGQLVGYPILDLEQFKPDLHWYLRQLEEVIILTIQDYGLTAGRFPAYTGVWLDPHDPQKARKICAIGVRAKRWITMHGFALNVNTNLDYFDWIIPCGIKEYGVSSLEKELGKKIPLDQVAERVKVHFESVFGAKPEQG